MVGGLAGLIRDRRPQDLADRFAQAQNSSVSEIKAFLCRSRPETEPLSPRRSH
jgi:hypothetical protein